MAASDATSSTTTVRRSLIAVPVGPRPVGVSSVRISMPSRYPWTSPACASGATRPSGRDLANPRHPEAGMVHDDPAGLVEQPLPVLLADHQLVHFGNRPEEAVQETKLLRRLALLLRVDCLAPAQQREHKHQLNGDRAGDPADAAHVAASDQPGCLSAIDLERQRPGGLGDRAGWLPLPPRRDSLSSRRPQGRGPIPRGRESVCWHGKNGWIGLR